MLKFVLLDFVYFEYTQSKIVTVTFFLNLWNLFIQTPLYQGSCNTIPGGIVQSKFNWTSEDHYRKLVNREGEDRRR